MPTPRWTIVAAVLAAGCAARSAGIRVRPDGVAFRLRRPAAASVSIAGDFNGWSADAHPMTREGDVWTRSIALPPGEHVFMYVIDGREWVTPPDAEHVPDGFGGTNGRVLVP